jgi:mRNA deadenylase 3'-5' endonuclease subunit Ccr4
MEEVRSIIDRRGQWPLLTSVYRRYTEVMADDIRESVMESGRKEWSGWEGEGPHHPPFTHYVDRYQGTLDHIFVVEGGEEREEEGESRLEVVAVLEIPTEEVVTRQTALPNEVFGSDHLAIGMKCRLHC